MHKQKKQGIEDIKQKMEKYGEVNCRLEREIQVISAHINEQGMSREEAEALVAETERL